MCTIDLSLSKQLLVRPSDYLKINVCWIYCEISEKYWGDFKMSPTNILYEYKCELHQKPSMARCGPVPWIGAPGRLRILGSTFSRKLTLFIYKEIIDTLTTSLLLYDRICMQTVRFLKGSCGKHNKTIRKFPRSCWEFNRWTHDFQGLYKPPKSIIVFLNNWNFGIFGSFVWCKMALLKCFQEDWLMMGDIHKAIFFI